MVEKVSASTLPQGTGSGSSALKLEPGTELKARVDSNLPGGVVRLASAEGRVELRVSAPLPANAEVTVTVTGTKQQPSIVITTDKGATQTGPQSTAGQQGQATPTHTTAVPNNPRPTNASLSNPPPSNQAQPTQISTNQPTVLPSRSTPAQVATAQTGSLPAGSSGAAPSNAVLTTGASAGAGTVFPATPVGAHLVQVLVAGAGSQLSSGSSGQPVPPAVASNPGSAQSGAGSSSAAAPLPGQATNAGTAPGTSTVLPQSNATAPTGASSVGTSASGPANVSASSVLPQTAPVPNLSAQPTSVGAPVTSAPTGPHSPTSGANLPPTGGQASATGESNVSLAGSSARPPGNPTAVLAQSAPGSGSASGATPNSAGVVQNPGNVTASTSVAPPSGSAAQTMPAAGNTSTTAAFQNTGSPPTGVPAQALAAGASPLSGANTQPLAVGGPLGSVAPSSQAISGSNPVQPQTQGAAGPGFQSGPIRSDLPTTTATTTAIPARSTPASSAPAAGAANTSLAGPAPQPTGAAPHASAPQPQPPASGVQPPLSGPGQAVSAPQTPLGTLPVHGPAATGQAAQQQAQPLKSFGAQPYPSLGGSAALKVSGGSGSGNPAPAAQIARVAQQALSDQQQGLTSLFAQVGSLTGAQAAGQVSLPDPVVRAMQQILGLRLNLSGGPSAGDLQNAVRLSGQFREAQLALPSGAATGTADLKSVLLSFRSLLQQFGAKPEVTRPAGQAPAPSRSAAPQGQAPQAASGFWAGAAPQNLQALLKDTDAALARLRLTQLANTGLARDSGPQLATKPMDVVLELPLSLGQETAVMQLQIGRDGSGTQQENDSEPGWRLRFALDLTATGPLEAAISLRGGGTYASLWVDRKETFDNLNAVRETMEAAFADAGLDLQELRLIRGLPPKTAALYGAMIDRQS